MIEVGAVQYKTRSDATQLWALVVAQEPIRSAPAAVQAQAKGRLTKWVTENTHGSVIRGTKGRFYRHNAVADVARMLLGRINEAQGKQTEKELAEKIHDNQQIKTYMNAIHGMLRARVNGLSDEYKAEWQTKLERSRGRYGHFWGTSTLNSRGNRNVWEGLQELRGKWGGTASCSIIAAWLCDFALAARNLPAGPTGSLPFMNDPAIHNAGSIPDGHSGSSTRYNANESHHWVQAARAACVRIGAGPSNTTGQVLSAIDTLLVGRPGYRVDTHGWYTGLSLFAFWTRHRSKLQAASEIHTYHEVMCVVKAFGIEGPIAVFEVGADDSPEVVGLKAIENENSMRRARASVANFEYVDWRELP